MEDVSIKTALDREMETVVLSSSVMDVMVFYSQNKYRRRCWTYRNLTLTVIVVVLLIAVPAVGMPLYEQWDILVNGKQIPDLDPMKVVQINDALQKDEDLNIVFSSMDELEKFLGVHFLSSSYAGNSGSQRIRYEKTGIGWNKIHIAAYVLGDASDIGYISEEKDKYTWTPGTLYKKPANLTISFTSSVEQKDVGMEYLGAYSFVESYASKQGYAVQILETESAYESYIAIFVADGIRYDLEVMTTLDEVKNIVDSFGVHN